MDWAHIFTTHEFWTGAIGSGLLTGAITYLSTRASDKRKFHHEDKVRDEESLYNVAMEYAETCSDILMNFVDIKGAFNVIRDMLYNRTNADDPKAEDKIDHAAKAMEQMKRITVPYNKLRMIAPKGVIAAAVDLNTAMMAVLRTTPEPFAQPVTHKLAADALENGPGSSRGLSGSSGSDGS
jgi:hypothetical protein